MRRRGCDRKFQASRLAVGEECDLAILTVDDEEFWEGASPLTFGELPELTDDVSVIGYLFHVVVVGFHSVGQHQFSKVDKYKHPRTAIKSSVETASRFREL